MNYKLVKINNKYDLYLNEEKIFNISFDKYEKKGDILILKKGSEDILFNTNTNKTITWTKEGSYNINLENSTINIFSCKEKHIYNFDGKLLKSEKLGNNDFVNKELLKSVSNSGLDIKKIMELYQGMYLIFFIDNTMNIYCKDEQRFLFETNFNQIEEYDMTGNLELNKNYLFEYVIKTKNNKKLYNLKTRTTIFETDFEIVDMNKSLFLLCNKKIDELDNDKELLVYLVDIENQSKCLKYDLSNCNIKNYEDIVLCKNSLSRCCLLENESYFITNTKDDIIKIS